MFLQHSNRRGVIRRLHSPLAFMPVRVCWYAAYPLITRNLEEMMAERGVLVENATVQRRALRIFSVLAKASRRRQVLVGQSWRVDETYERVGGE